MARAWRIEYDGPLYHVLSRGNDRQDIFRDDQDRSRFLESIGEMSERYEIDIFAYVLKGNHHHLLLRTNRSLTNGKIGDIFGVSYSLISHIVKSVQSELDMNKECRDKFMKIYSLFKM